MPTLLSTMTKSSTLTNIQAFFLIPLIFLALAAVNVLGIFLFVKEVKQKDQPISNGYLDYKKANPTSALTQEEWVAYNYLLRKRHATE